MPTFICLHCSGSSARQWTGLAAALAPRHPTILPDLIGYGDGPPIAEAGVTLDDEASRIAAIVDATHGPVCLVGHSYGGAVATRVALRRRDRVVGLALYEPVLFSLIARGADADPAGREIVATGLSISTDVRSGRLEQAARRFVDYWSGDGAWQAMDPRRRQGVCARMPKVAQEFAALFDDAEPLSVYARLTMPVLWLEGETTRTPPQAVARRVVPALADARHVRIPGAGHMGPITHAQAVNVEILRFVRSLVHRGCPTAAGAAATKAARTRAPGASPMPATPAHRSAAAEFVL
jgi:pimeloyl-ACP methyl ester carboxylesterase